MEALCVRPKPSNGYSGWKHYVSDQSLPTDIVDYMFFYLQKLISHSLTGKLDGLQKLNLADMEILTGFFYGKNVGYGTALVTQWMNIIRLVLNFQRMDYLPSSEVPCIRGLAKPKDDNSGIVEAHGGHKYLEGG